MKKTLLAAALLTAAQAHATILNIDFTGTVTETNNFLYDQFSVGDIFNIYVQIDTDAPRTSEYDEHTPWFGNSVTDLRISSGDFNATFNPFIDGSSASGEGSCGVAIGTNRGYYDIQGCALSNPFTGYAFGDSFPAHVISDYVAVTGMRFDSISGLDDIPLLEDGADWGFRYHFLVLGSGGSETQLFGDITEMNVSVSEPSSFAMLGLGLAGLGLYRRKKA